MSQYFWRQGDPERAVELSAPALMAGREFGDLALLVTANMRLGQAYHRLGDYPRAIEALLEAIRPLEGELSRARFGVAALPSVVARGFLVWSHLELGQLREATRHADDGLRIAEEANQAYSLSWALFCLGLLHIRTGEIHGALPVLERGLSHCRATEVPVMLAYHLAMLGYAYALSGRALDGLPLLEQSVESSTFSKTGQHLFPFLFLTEAYLRAGRVADAVRMGSHGLHLCESRKERGLQAWALHLLGDVASRANPPDVEGAEDRYRQAMALAEGLGMRPLVGHCHLGLGRLLRDRGEVATAAEIFRSIEMTYWLRQAEAELAKAG
jgi:tetratricopeptide (TPR) repeat protein